VAVTVPWSGPSETDFYAKSIGPIDFESSLLYA